MESKDITITEASSDGVIFRNAFDWTAFLQQVCKNARWMHFQSDPVKLIVTVSSLWTFDKTLMITCWFFQELHPGKNSVSTGSKVMIEQVCIPKNNLPLWTHFYQFIAKAPVECICRHIPFIHSSADDLVSSEF